MTELPLSPHIVQVERKWRCTCATLPPEVTQRFEAALRGGRWWLDRWTQRGFQRAALDALQTDAPGGLIFLARGLSFTAPPPFTEAFEPIELGAGDAQLKTLSGNKPTRQERANRILIWVFAVIGVALAMLFMRTMVALGPTRVLGGLGIVGVLVTTSILLAMWAMRWGGAWFLIPGGVAIVRRPRKNRPPVELCTARDAYVLMRLVSNGKTVMLNAELYRRDGQRFQRAVSDREALALLAAWQSPLVPPPPERLAELAIA